MAKATVSSPDERARRIRAILDEPAVGHGGRGVEDLKHERELRLAKISQRIT